MMFARWLAALPPAPYEATRLRPRQEGEPAARIHVYSNLGAPMVAIYIRGAWRIAHVGTRHLYPDGRIGYQLTAELGRQPGNASTQESGTYLWDPAVFRIIYRGN